MPAGRVERKLSAILAADIAGYSRLMGADEEGTLASLNSHRDQHIDPCIGRHRGRIVKTTGDGLLVEFASVVDAVRCAVELQAGMAARNAGIAPDRRFDFRIGINVGDIVEQDGDIFGDGVNIAARLEGIAEPGGIAVSGRVQEDAFGRVGAIFEDMGEQALKNISRPIRAYRLRPMDIASATPGAAPPRSALRLPDKPSIAVLPFQNISGDPEQEYFADGMVEEIVTALSRNRWLFVIARNSSFTYKGRAVDVKQIGRELGVRYILEGSVRKAGEKLRIAGQLVDAASGAHLWADRFDGGLGDVFDLQDRVAASVVGIIGPKLEQAEIERSKHKPTDSLDAYDFYLRGMSALYLGTNDANSEASRFFYGAIDRDPEFAAAHAMAAFCVLWRKTNGWMTDSAGEVAESERLVHRAVALGRDYPLVLARSGHTLAFVANDLDGGVGLIDAALALDPNLAVAWYASGWIRTYLGEHETAIEHLARGMRLSPLDPETNQMQVGTALAHFLAGRYGEASIWAQRALRERPDYLSAMRIAAASAALAGNLDAARPAMERLQRLDPALRVSNLGERLPFRRPEDLAGLADGLRRAGLRD